MDTNRTHDNNYQINSFVKGMNSDTSYDQMDSAQYLFGLNIRVTNNQLLFGDEITSNNTELIVSPVPFGIGSTSEDLLYDIVVGNDKCICGPWYKKPEETSNATATVTYKIHFSTNNLKYVDDGLSEDYPYIIRILGNGGKYITVSYNNVKYNSPSSGVWADYGITLEEPEGEDPYITIDLYQLCYKLNITIFRFCIVYHLSGTPNYGAESGIQQYEARINISDELSSVIKAKSILAVDAIDNVGCVITKNLNNTWTIYKAEYSSSTTSCNFTEIYTSTNTTNKDKFSVALIRETVGVMKAYVADGEDPVLCFFLENDEIETNGRTLFEYYSGVSDIMFAAANMYFPTSRPTLSKIAGNLKTSQVQYTYRFYRRYGNASRLCPLTNKIQIISDNRNREEGNAEDTTTNIGIRLTIPVKQNEGGMFNYVQVFRISYIKYQQEPEIALIYDRGISNLTYNNENPPTASLTVDDIGTESLAQYSLEEFSALQTQTIVPQCIESTHGYLFQANAEDRTMINDTTSSTVHATPVYFEMNIDNGDPSIEPYAGGLSTLNTLKLAKSFTGDVEYGWNIDNDLQGGVAKALGTDLTIGGSDYTVSNYLSDCGVLVEGEDMSYNNMFVSSLFRSIRIDDDYQYGIVYYDKYGRRSDVTKIPLYTGGRDHTQTGKLKISLNSDLFSYQSGEGTIAKIYGAFFKVELPNDNIVGYEIVRCEKSFNYTKNILQVALSRPLVLGKYIDENKRTPYYPNVYLSSDFYYTYYGPLADTGSVKDMWSKENWFDRGATNAENFELYLAFSPEINIARNDVLAKIKTDAVKLVPYNFVQENQNYLDSIARLEQDYIGDKVIHFEYDNLLPPYEKVQLSQVVENDITYLTCDNSFGVGHIYIPVGLCGDSADPKICCTSGSTVSYSDLPVISGTDVTFYVSGSQVKFGCSGEVIYKGVLCKRILCSTSSSSQLSATVYFKCKDVTFGQTLSLQYINSTNNLESALERIGETVHNITSGVYVSFKYYQNHRKEDKSSLNAVFKFNYVDTTQRTQDWYTAIDVKNAADVKNPNWENGFSDVQYTGSGSNIVVGSAIKLYKSYATSIGGKTYNNWVSNGMYDLATTLTEGAAQPGNVSVNNSSDVGVWNVYNKRTGTDADKRSFGFIGPGPVCLLLNLAKLATDNNKDAYGLYKQNGNTNLGTLVANITHDTIDYSDTNQVYYGFGNFRKFDGDTDYTVVFDGEMYPDFAEFTNMFKTYDFKDRDYTLISGQTVYYIPLSSTINTYFDYGQNYRNTQSANLMLEPGQIEGIASQERPLHQYNMIYSDNDWSINSFFESPEKKPDNEFPQRIYYSQLKTNGEPIDNWLITKPADFIDADSKYGQITNLLAQDNTMYFWQEVAFGKLSVNERSLVTDNNGEQIQLGQGGVLQRTDYLSTKYGMREQDYAAINTEDALFWIDIVNKAVVMCRNNQVVNYGETLNVQNILNTSMSVDRPTIHYDLQNNELLCKCLTNGNQLVFNTKYGYATSVYTRRYDDAAVFNNTIIGLHITDNNEITFIKYNNITSDEFENEFLSPTILSFVVNSSPSQTKVFDNQKVVTMSRKWNAYGETDTPDPKLPYYLKSEYTDRQANYFTNKEYKFETSIKQTSSKPEAMTDREGNICYAIPREGAVDFATGYGNRMRGKWLKVTITDKDPKQDYCISHIITKFRQSFS